MTDFPRLIEKGFCLEQASLDSVHEKNVRHGHISTLHIWPARRPLAACRAALIATLLPDPGTPEERRKTLERLGGKVVRKVEHKKMPGGRVVEQVKAETEGGILHWGRESGPDLDWFREQIRKVYGRAPKVLDPFAGGGAIPLEAMRLGCEVTAADINPVAWFLLKCTLEYPQKLAGKKHPLPGFVLKDQEFMEEFYKATGDPGLRPRRSRQHAVDLWQSEQTTAGQSSAPQADLAWQVRAWGRWVLKQAKKDLAGFYPTYAGFEPLDPDAPYEKRESKLAPVDENGDIDTARLNSEFTEEYLAKKANPRWVPKPTVAYLWARTVKCKDCRATVPLLKTRWLCKKDKKRVLLTMEPNADRTGVVFGVQTDVPEGPGNAADRREQDKRIGTGTMSRSGAKCPCCGTIMTMDDIKAEGKAGRLGSQMTAVVVEGQRGKEYRLPTSDEIRLAAEAEGELDRVFAEIPFGLPDEPMPSKEALGFRAPLYGFDRWSKLFTTRQLLSLGVFVKTSRKARVAMPGEGYRTTWVEALGANLAVANDKLADYIASLCTWHITGEKMSHVFVRFALPITWDYAELNPLSESSGNYVGCIDWVSRVADHTCRAATEATVTAIDRSAIVPADSHDTADLILTDPPYYDAIPYSDLTDFFYVWLRRSLSGLSPEINEAFREQLAPKWDHAANDGELIDDASRHGGDKAKSRAAYEDGMFRAFQACYQALRPEGRLVIVFAHKHPDAWETLVSAIIRAGFVVDASWPIQTEMGNRTRALSSAALSSSVWLVCKKRPEATRSGWDNAVLEEMQSNIHSRLRDFWDAGIRGPDFVWAATGPALEAYSKYPVVRKANEPGQLMEVSEFLRAVRRIVVDFVVGRVLSGDGVESVSGLDDVTTYYLLHRHGFGMADIAAGACILYAVSCGLSDRDLADQYDILQRARRQEAEQEDDDQDESGESEDEGASEGGATVKIKAWDKRRGKNLGLDLENRPSPLIDQVHHTMHLWKSGNVNEVDEYLDARGLRRHQLFHQLLQALIELAGTGSEERSLLESISNHVGHRGAAPRVEQEKLAPPVTRRPKVN